MGVIYKLKPEIKDFIIEEKKTHPELSCRKLIFIIYNKFQIRVSKSSINSVIKEAGLSLPVGRRSKKKIMPVIRQPAEEKTEAKEEAIIPKDSRIPNQDIITQPDVAHTVIEKDSRIESSGIILLKAADYLLGGTDKFTELCRMVINRPDPYLKAKAEGALYLSLLGYKDFNEKLSSLTGVDLTKEDIDSYLNDLQGVTDTKQELVKVISNIVQEVRYIKISLLEGTPIYLDPQMYTLWPTPNIPLDFSVTLCDRISYDIYFKDSIVLFAAPGYDVPLKEFFDFTCLFEPNKSKIEKITLFGNKFEEIGSLSHGLDFTKARLIFALWPWQFANYRNVKKVNEFKSFYSRELGKEIYLAEIEVEITQPDVGQGVMFKGVAVKTGVNEKIRLAILTNPSSGSLSCLESAELYFSKWPNLEDAFQDYSRKIEAFSYTAGSQRLFSTEARAILRRTPPLDLKTVFESYLKVLDLYVKFYLLPQGFEGMSFSDMKDNIYNINNTIELEQGIYKSIFSVTGGYRFKKELAYACQRLNEKNIYFRDKIKMKFFL